MSLIKHARLSPRGAAARGLSLVELMVGITIGLIVVAGATLLTASQLSENRRLLLETQVQQDLRAAADIIARDVRRGGYNAYADALMWSPDNPAVQPIVNPFRGLVLNNGAEVVAYKYQRDLLPFDFGYQWTSSGGVIRHRTNGAAAQELTDRTALRITAFEVTAEPTGTRQLACPTLCPDGTQNCWPTLTLNDVRITITGAPVSNPQLSRTVTSRVRLRNEGLVFAPQVCP
jgi:type II secretory pathway pseudopilin PulG